MSKDIEFEQSVNTLHLHSTIGFSGKVKNGLAIHPDKKHLIYAIGGTVVIQNLMTKSQKFLHGHTNSITCLAVSNTGRYIATGQVTFAGFKAQIIIWDFERKTKLYSYNVHRVSVKALSFSPNDKFIASLGAEDDSTVALFDLLNGKPISGAPASRDSAGHTLCLTYSNTNEHLFITAGEYDLRVWSVDPKSKKLTPTECQFGSLKRVITCVTLDHNDEFMWCTTLTGDILQVSVMTKLLKGYGPNSKSRTLLSNGAVNLNILGQEIVAGSGKGTIAFLERNLTVTRMVDVEGMITSIAVYDSNKIIVGTDQSNIFFVNPKDLSIELFSSAHYEKINDLVFPWDYSELFGTCSHGDIRVWNARTATELMRIHLPLITCNCIKFSRDGKSIISGWDDGKIRAFTPQTGKLIYTINDAHPSGVTVLGITSENDKIISGGKDGQVRSWRLCKQSQTLESSAKEHKGTITSLITNTPSEKFLTASTDGSCIVWDMNKMTSIKRLISETMFKDVAMLIDGSQAVTGGTDKKLVYWDLRQGDNLREVDNNGAIVNTVDIDQTGKFLVSAGVDKLIKIWNYDNATTIAEGHGHSGAVVWARISPDGKTVVSVGEEGAIYIWDMPNN